MVHPPSQLVLENKWFPYASVENPLWKRSQPLVENPLWVGPLPPHLTSVEPKRQSDEHNQAGANDFWSLLRILWACPLSPAFHNVTCPQLTSAIDDSPLQLVCQTLGTTSHEVSLEWDFWHIPWLTATFPYTPQILFCLTVAPLPLLKWESLKGQKHCLCSSIFSVKTVTLIHQLCSDCFNASRYDSCHDAV